jgi:hypothetical protein
MIWILIILVLINIFSAVVIYYALNKINQYENFILQFSQIIQFASEKMKQVDYSGHYESDDETGFFFEQLKQLQLIMNKLFNTPEENTDAEKKEK